MSDTHVNKRTRILGTNHPKPKPGTFLVHVTFVVNAGTPEEAEHKVTTEFLEREIKIGTFSGRTEYAMDCALHDHNCVGEALNKVPTYGGLCEHHYAQAIRINYSLSDVANLRAE